MTMSVEDLTDHALRLRDLLEAKRRRLGTSEICPAERAVLLRQIDALTARVDQITWECSLLKDGPLPAVLDLQSGSPGIGPLTEVVT